MDVFAGIAFVVESIRHVASASVSALPLASLVALVAWFGRTRLSPATRQTLWGLVLVRLLIPVAIPSPVGIGNFWLDDFSRIFFGSGGADAPHDSRVAPDPAAATVAASEIVAQPMPFDAPLAASTPKSPLASIHPLAWVLALGTLLVATRAVVCTWRLRGWLRRSVECRDPAALELLEEGRRAFGLRRTVALRVVSELAGPATIGWRRPIVLLPPAAAASPRDELRHILWHELAHVRRGDGALEWLPTIVRAFHWWNPVFWGAHRMWTTERELACDEEAVRKLGPDAAAAYGRTLLRFAATPTDAPPALAAFGGAKAALARRLRALSARGRATSRVGSLAAAALVATLGVVGLTDAAPPTSESSEKKAERSSSVSVPAGAVWRVEGSSDAASDASKNQAIEVRHDLAPAIKRMREDDATLSALDAAHAIRRAVARLTPEGWRAFSAAAFALGGAPSDPSLPTCRLEGETLTLVAPPATQEVVRATLRRWAEAGRRSVSTELRIVATKRELSELLPTAGGEIVTASSRASEFDFQPPAEADVSAATTPGVVRPSIPTYVRRLDEAEMRELMKAVQADAASQVLAAPRVTWLEGEWAMIFVGSETPLVRGYVGDGQGEPKPDVRPEQEGLRALLTARRDADDRVALRLQLCSTQIAEVETLRIGATGAPREVQIPHVVASRIDAAATLAADQTLLVAPLRREDDGRLRIVLATTRSVEAK